jgi:hypothetical protein
LEEPVIYIFRLFYPEDGSSRFLQNVVNLLLDYSALHFREL